MTISRLGSHACYCWVKGISLDQKGLCNRCLPFGQSTMCAGYICTGGIDVFAGVREMTVLGRSGRFEAQSDIGHAMRDGWAASVAVTKCDVAFAEDAAAVFARSSIKGQPARAIYIGKCMGACLLSCNGLF